ncbi:Hypothetical predicted protein [Mytilus galloprovincialis]|uniref:Uncharacterized protein n=1 Tax=Mytilus galloprovincialis TaxID=29158 RepID=A0A8B6FG78_MYTGA|nr:Hypothetical predicted protein [Mytilus galloprovincialis]
MENEMDENLPPALVMITIAFLLHIFGNATLYYFTIEYSNSIINSGLWTRCESNANDKECYNIEVYAVHVVFILIGTLLFVKNGDDIITEPDGQLAYGYSFALCISGMCLAALVDIVLIIELIKPKKNTRNRVDANSNTNIKF